jgi:hydrogenase expression/formation protein HypD
VKYIDEYRDPAAALAYRDAIHRLVTRPWTVMEVCGGQTHAIARFGVEDLLPAGVTLLHGPGCPVCVTPIEAIDRAIAIASRRDVIFCSYGDMLRVPGSASDLLGVRARGGDVRVVTSAMDALGLARRHPDRQVVFFAIGFETTAPGHVIAIREARRLGVESFSVLVSHVRVPPAMEHLLSGPERRVDAFLAAGHVCTIMGTAEYAPVAARHRVPIVVTGFEPLDILQGLHMALAQLEEGRAEVENQYARAVRPEGNPHARAAVEEVFEVVPRAFRGIGEIAGGGLRLREEYRLLDAESRFPEAAVTAEEPAECISGRVLQGLAKPTDCPAFGRRCTPDTPLGATMVSSEGACAAYHRYRRPS